MEETRVHWGKWVKARAKHLGIPLAALASAVGTTPRNLSKWLREENMPAIHKRFREPLAKSLNIDVRTLPFAFGYQAYDLDISDAEKYLPSKDEVKEFYNDEKALRKFVAWTIKDLPLPQLQKLVSYCHIMATEAMTQFVIDENRRRWTAERKKKVGF